MFNPFAQPAQNPAPAFNPFATKPNPPTQGNPFGQANTGKPAGSHNNAQTNPFAGAGTQGGLRKADNPFSAAAGNQTDNGAKTKFGSPFVANDGNSSDGSSKKHKLGKKSKRRLSANSSNMPNGSNGFLKPPPADSRQTNWKPRAGSQQTSNSSASSGDESDNPISSGSDDPHAKRVYEQLRKDGISPPQWPSKPGEPRNKAAMAKFRESYEAYRARVRKSLTKAGLIDDPDKRKSLKDAIVFKGICEDMCPEFEKITRITEIDVNQPEKNPRNNVPNTRRMVKKLARSAAGQEAPLPMDVRSIMALKRSLDYLVDVLLRNDGNLPVVHGFLWDRTRAIRRDFTFFSSMTPQELKTQVYVLENIARFHVTALHLLSQEGRAPEDFVEQQELEQLGKALLSLRDVYDDCNEQGIVCDNEAEFRAYYLVFHANDPNIMEMLQRQWSPKLWRDSDEVRTAISLVEAMQSTQDFHGPLTEAPSMAASSAYQSYFRIVEDPQVSYTMACFAECHFPRVRRAILASVKRALSRPKESAKDVTAEELNKFLRFDTVQEAIDFAELHGMEFVPNAAAPLEPTLQHLVLNSRGPLSHPRLQHQFSKTLVERKRGEVALPTLIHQTVVEGSSAPDKNNNAAEESLFVQDDGASRGIHQATPTAPAASWGQSSQTKSPFAQESKPSGFPAVSGSLTTEGPAAQSKASGFAPAFSNPFATAQPPSQTASSQSKNAFAVASGSTENKDVAKPSTPQLGSGLTPSPFSQAQSSAAANPTNKPNPFASASPFTKPSPNQQASTVNPAEPATGSTVPTPKIPALPGAALTPSISSPAATSSAARPMFPSPQQPAPAGEKAPINFTTSPKPTLATATGAEPAFSTTPQQPPSSNNPPLAPSLATAPPPVATPPTPLAPTFKKPSPPRDVVGDFTKWFALGDNGLLDEFQIYLVESMLQDVFKDFMKKQEETRRKEEEDRDNAKADEFRKYNLSLRMFYRWRNNAREKRLREVRRQGREQARAFYEEQRAKESRARKEAALRAKAAQVKQAEVDHPQELMSMLKSKKASRKEAEEALLASGVLSGVSNEQEAARKIVHREYESLGAMLPPSGRSTRSPSVSSTARREGSKTRALRESLMGNNNSSFRRSLPSVSSRSSASPEASSRTSKVSSRWRLKAMGLVTLPDGTAVPESLAREATFGRGVEYPSSRPVSQGNFSRRGSMVDAARPETQFLSRSQGSDNQSGAVSPNKRKRPSDDDGAVARVEDGEETSSHKRVMSDAEKVLSELRAMRVEMEEDVTWFRSQNERLQSEAASRGSTPWGGSI